MFCSCGSHDALYLCLSPVTVAVYGAILGGMEKKAMEIATELNGIVNEEMFTEYPELTAYLESYAAMDIHIMIRFGRWKELLEIEPPKNKALMLYRAASLKFARASEMWLRLVRKQIDSTVCEATLTPRCAFYTTILWRISWRLIQPWLEVKLPTGKESTMKPLSCCARLWTCRII